MKAVAELLPWSVKSLMRTSVSQYLVSLAGNDKKAKQGWCQALWIASNSKTIP